MTELDQIKDQLRDAARYANHLEGKVVSALAIADGPTFGCRDGDLADVLMILRAAIKGEG